MRNTLDVRRVLESIPQIVWTTRPDGTIEDYNQRWTEYTGVALEPEGPSSWASVIHPDDRAEVEARWAAAMAARGAFEMEYRLRDASGSYQWHLGRSLPIAGKDGEIVGWFGTATNIEAQKRAVLELRAAHAESEARRSALELLTRIGGELAASLDYQATLANVARLVVPAFADACTVELLVDEATLATEQVAAAHVDPAKTELLRTFRREFPVDPREPYGTGEVIRTGVPEHYPDIPDALIDQTSRSPRYAELLRAIGLRSTITVSLVARGRPLGAISFVRGASDRRFDRADVALAREIALRAALAIDQARVFEEQRQEREQLRVAERRFRTLAEATSLIVWSVGPDARPLVDSPSWRAFTGQTAEQWLGGEGWSAIHPDDEPAMREIWTHAIATSTPIECESRLRRHDGVYLPMVVRGVPIVGADGVAREWIGTHTDVSSRKRAELRQRTLTQATTELASSFDQGRSPAVLVRLVSEAIGDCCVLTLFDRERQVLETVAAYHPDPAAAPLLRAIEKTVTPIEGHLPGQAFVGRRPVRRNDVNDDTLSREATPALLEFRRRFGVSAVLVAPLLVDGEVIGTLGVSRDRGGPPYGDDDEAFLTDFASRTSTLLHNARLYQAAEEARRSLATTLRSIGDAVIATDATGRISFLNPIAERLTGWSSAEAAGRPLADVFRIVDERTGAPVESPVDKVLREGVVVGLANHTVLLGRGHAAPTPIDDSGAPIRDDKGRLTGVVLVFRDVTAKKRAEERRDFLAAAGAELSSSLDYESTLAKVARLAVPRLADWCGVDIVDEGQTGFRQLAVAHVDPAKLAMAVEFGRKYPADQHAETGVPNVLRTGKSELWPEIPLELLRKAAVDDEHLRLILELRLESAMVVPLTARGRTFGAISFLYADSGRRYSEDDVGFAEELAHRAAIAVDNARLYRQAIQLGRDLEDALRVRDNFISMASHELKTPLTGLSLQLQSLRRQVRKGIELEPERLVGKVEIAQGELGRLASLVDDLLDVSRLAAGKLHLELAPVDCGALVAAVAARFDDELREANCPLTLDAPTAVIATTDRARLDQVVTNLLTNAMKYGRGEPIEISVRQRGDRLHVQVRDHGIGIPAESQRRIFERFERALGARAIGGIGLGLWIVRNVLDALGGTIAVESEPGRGSVFTVDLPLEPVAPPPSATGETARE